jgi:Tfp pilus assembly protein PilF
MVVLAQAYLAIGAPEEANRQLEHALKITPTLGPANYYYGHLLLKQKRWAEALPHLLEALRWQPDDFWLHYELAQAYQGSSQLDRALSHFHQAYALDHRRPEVLNAIGAVHVLQGNYPEARSYLEQALLLDPGNPEALTNIAGVELQAHHFQEAILYFQRALPRTSAPLAVYHGLLKAYAATGQKAEVQRILGKLPDPPMSP